MGCIQYPSNQAFWKEWKKWNKKSPERLNIAKRRNRITTAWHFSMTFQGNWEKVEFFSNLWAFGIYVGAAKAKAGIHIWTQREALSVRCRPPRPWFKIFPLGAVLKWPTMKTNPEFVFGSSCSPCIWRFPTNLCFPFGNGGRLCKVTRFCWFDFQNIA